MQRFCAALLLVLFGFTPALPLMAAPGDEKMPSCCRREGQHHCRMTNSRMTNSGMANVSSQQQGPAIAEKCPLRASWMAVLAFANPIALSEVQAFFNAIAKYPLIQAQTEALLRVSFSRSRQKRGPPAFSC